MQVLNDFYSNGPSSLDGSDLADSEDPCGSSAGAPTTTITNSDSQIPSQETPVASQRSDITSNNSMDVDRAEVDGENRRREVPHRRLQLHNPVICNTHNCPPFLSIQSVWVPGAVCDCVAGHDLPCCVQRNNFAFFKEEGLDFEDIFHTASSNVNNRHAESNDSLRHYLYRKCAQILDFGQNERRRLPVCVEARIRQIYPEKNGLYTGYQEKNVIFAD